jgi:hypothetical protein
MKRLFEVKYPKILTLIGFTLTAYIIFSDPFFAEYVKELHQFGYYSMFLFGSLFTFGFTTPFAIGYFLTYTPTNIWIAGIIGGIGAMIGDLLIFKFVKFSFEDEFNKIRKEKLTRKVDHTLKFILGKKIKHYLTYAFAGIIIASPLPDEAGVTMLAGLTEIKPSILAIISFIFNTIGILIFLKI